ncbi:cupin domain-containing protein [Nocardia sp. NPDC019304]|uniref:helix-turn-helix domain-containing protein n=1 Tax=unclassified Nocardia TaxID=2637762 RepID=UPI0033E8B249
MSRAKSSQTGQSSPAWTAGLGQKLRALRDARKVSLAAVSEVTGISASFLSLLEQGRTDVSLGRLLPLLGYYGVELSDVLPGPAEPADRVVRSGARPVAFSAATGIEVFLATRDRGRTFVPLVVEFSADSTMSDWSRHAGEEFLFVLEGRLELDLIGAAPVILDCGDSLFIGERRGHRLAALDGKPARALIVTTRTGQI